FRRSTRWLALRRPVRGRRLRGALGGEPRAAFAAELRGRRVRVPAARACDRRRRAAGAAEPGGFGEGGSAGDTLHATDPSRVARGSCGAVASFGREADNDLNLTQNLGERAEEVN